MAIKKCFGNGKKREKKMALCLNSIGKSRRSFVLKCSLFPRTHKFSLRFRLCGKYLFVFLSLCLPCVRTPFLFCPFSSNKFISESSSAVIFCTNRRISKRPMTKNLRVYLFFASFFGCFRFTLKENFSADRFYQCQLILMWIDFQLKCKKHHPNQVQFRLFFGW